MRRAMSATADCSIACGGSAVASESNVTGFDAMEISFRRKPPPADGLTNTGAAAIMAAEARPLHMSVTAPPINTFE